MSLEHKVRQIIKRTSVDGDGNSGSTQLTSVALLGDSMTHGNNALTGVTSATRSGGVVTVVSAAHGLGAGTAFCTVNMVPPDFNVLNAKATYIDANTFSYPAPGADGVAAGIDAAKPMLITKVTSAQDTGYFFWLQSASKGAFRCAVNAGASGQTAANMLARLPAVLAVPSQQIILFTGYNDFVREGRLASAVLADMQAMATAVLATGRKIVIVSAIPWTTGGTTAGRGEAAAYNRAMASWCQGRAGCRYVDAARQIVDATAATRFSPLSGFLRSDGIHPNPKGAKTIGAAIWSVMQPDVPAVSRLVSSNADNWGFRAGNSNIQDEAPWTASGGTVTAPATGTAASALTVSQSATGAVVASTVARSDGLGYNQRMVLTPSANNDLARVTLTGTIASARLPVGGKIQLLCELALTNVNGSNLRGFNAYLTFGGPAGAANINGYAVTCVSSVASDYPQVDDVLTIVSPEIDVPTGATSVTWQVFGLCGAAGTAVTIDVGRISLEVVA